MKKSKAENWKNMDLNLYVTQDLKAAITLLDLIITNPSILSAVVVEVEKLRQRMIENEVNQSQSTMQPSNPND